MRSNHLRTKSDSLNKIGSSLAWHPKKASDLHLTNSSAEPCSGRHCVKDYASLELCISTILKTSPMLSKLNIKSTKVELRNRERGICPRYLFLKRPFRS
jgi:hypothetical protein